MLLIYFSIHIFNLIIQNFWKLFNPTFYRHFFIVEI